MVVGVVLAVRNLTAVSLYLVIMTLSGTSDSSVRSTASFAQKGVLLYSHASEYINIFYISHKKNQSLPKSRRWTMGKKLKELIWSVFTPKPIETLRDVAAGFTPPKPGICKAVCGELRAAMALLFLVLRSPSSRQTYPCYSAVCGIDVTLEIQFPN